jgi:hypothetical protein
MSSVSKHHHGIVRQSNQIRPQVIQQSAHAVVCRYSPDQLLVLTSREKHTARCLGWPSQTTARQSTRPQDLAGGSVPVPDAVDRPLAHAWGRTARR